MDMLIDSDLNENKKHFIQFKNMNKNKINDRQYIFNVLEPKSKNENDIKSIKMNTNSTNFQSNLNFRKTKDNFDFDENNNFNNSNEKLSLNMKSNSKFITNNDFKIIQVFESTKSMEYSNRYNPQYLLDEKVLKINEKFDNDGKNRKRTDDLIKYLQFINAKNKSDKKLDFYINEKLSVNKEIKKKNISHPINGKNVENKNINNEKPSKKNSESNDKVNNSNNEFNKGDNNNSNKRNKSEKYSENYSNNNKPNKLLISNQNIEFIVQNNKKYKNDNNENENSKLNDFGYKSNCKCKYFHQNKFLMMKYHFFTDCFVCDLSN